MIDLPKTKRERNRERAIQELRERAARQGKELVELCCPGCDRRSLFMKDMVPVNRHYYCNGRHCTRPPHPPTTPGSIQTRTSISGTPYQFTFFVERTANAAELKAIARANAILSAAKLQWKRHG